MAKNNSIIDFTKIIKRLELIKNLISLEEENEISEQVDKLQKLVIDDTVKSIIKHLQKKSYGIAVKEIEIFINKNNQVAIYVDPEIEALRFEAKALEFEIQQRSDEKVELDKLVYEFSVRHNKELGELIIKILKYRKEKSKGTKQQAEAEKDYENFYSNFEAIKKEKIADLTKEELKELKDKYRKASKLCHPDVVEESQKETAHKIFTELNAAYARNDLKRVSEILESLQQGKIFTSKADTANEKLTLQVEIERLRMRLHDLNEEINKIKTSETYEQILNITDWDEYFAKTKLQLQEQLNLLSDDGK